MDTFLQGFGLVACLGVILIVALGMFIFRRFSSSRNTPNRQRGIGNTPTTQGGERPRHDSSRVESSGGFGSSSGSSRSSSNPPARRSGAASYEDRRGAPAPRPRDRRSSRDRDDRPTGGFGSG